MKERRPLSGTCELIQNSHTFQRGRIALLICVGILLSFLFLSRYPALLAEYVRASTSTLLDRDVGMLSKDAMLMTHNVKGSFELFLTASIDWFDTNKIGMTFGFFFSASILLLLEQSVFLRERGLKNGFQGVLSGLLLGMPLGVCTNCATPVALGLNKSGVSDDASFTTLIASPSLNPLGMGMLFFLFPFELGVMRIGLILGFLFLILPLLTRTFGGVTAPLFEVSKPDLKAKPSETWQESLTYCFKRYRYYLFYTFKQVLPAMVIMGLLGTLLLVIFPFQTFILKESTTLLDIILAGIIGTVLPVPMFVDLVIIFMLHSLGLSLAITVTLLLTMAPTSAFALYVMGKNTRWRLSLSIGVSIALLGIFSGIFIHYQQMALGDSNEQTEGFSPFKIIKTVPSKKAFDFDTFDTFFGSGVSVYDYNQDGQQDILLPGDHGARLYRNQGNMHFTDQTAGSGINGTLNTMAGIWGDYNNDGLADLYLVNYRGKDKKAESNRLYKNLGNGQFEEVTESMQLSAQDYSSSAAWADFDNDGDLDLFVTNYGRIWLDGGNAIHGESQTDRLYRNDGHKFTDITEEAGVGGVTVESNKLLEIDNDTIAANRGFSFQPVWFDFNNDNLMDLYISQDFGTGQLYQNKGDGTFKNVTKLKGLNIYGTGMGVSVTDINQDGFWDLLVSTGGANQLWVNQKGKYFSNEAEKYQIDDHHRFGWGVAQIDVENSMDQAYLVINGATAKGSQLNHYQQVIMEVNSQDKFFVKRKGSKNKSKFLAMDKKYGLYSDKIGRGLALGDLDNDGYVDMVVSNRDSQAQMVVYQNKTKSQGQGNHYLKIKLKGGEGINAMAVGTKVSLYIKGTVQHQLLSAGSSFLSQHSPVLTFGLGTHTLVDKIIISWPNGKQKTLHNIKGDQCLEVSV